MKKIIVTPAGRRRFLSILSKYLIYFKNKEEFDEWHLWCNTDDKEDIKYMENMAHENDFIKLKHLGNHSSLVKGKIIRGFVNLKGHKYFANTIPYFIKKCIDKNSVYLRLDDDIVFIKKNSIKDLFNYRIKNKKNFLVYGNIVNNSVLSYLHQQIKILPETRGKVGFDSRDKLGLYNGRFAEFCHNIFFNKFSRNQLEKYRFRHFWLKKYTHVSIQVISWHGSRFAKFGGIIPENIHEEDYVAEIKPKIDKTPNIIFGNGLFCHYSAEVQRDYLDTTNVLSRYVDIAEKYLSN